MSKLKTKRIKKNRFLEYKKGKNHIKYLIKRKIYNLIANEQIKLTLRSM